MGVAVIEHQAAHVTDPVDDVPFPSRQTAASTSRELAKLHVADAIKVLVRNLNDPDGKVSNTAAIALLNRAEGLPTAKVDMSPTLGPALKALLGLAHARDVAQLPPKTDNEGDGTDDDAG